MHEVSTSYSLRKVRKKEGSDKGMEINLGQLAFDIDFHPSQQLVTTGLINGDLHLYRYTSDSVPERSIFSEVIFFYFSLLLV